MPRRSLSLTLEHICLLCLHVEEFVQIQIQIRDALGPLYVHTDVITAHTVLRVVMTLDTSDQTLSRASNMLSSSHIASLLPQGLLQLVTTNTVLLHHAQMVAIDILSAAQATTYGSSGSRRECPSSARAVQDPQPRSAVEAQAADVQSKQGLDGGDPESCQPQRALSREGTPL